MNGRKEGGQQGGGKGTNTELCRGGYLDPEAIWLSCSVRLLAKNLPWTSPDPHSLSVSPFLPLIHCAKAITCDAHQHSVYLTSPRFIPVNKKSLISGFSDRGQHLALGWPLALEATVQARANAGHKALPYHAQALAFVTPSSSVP